MITLIDTPNGKRLVRSTTRRQAVDHVVKGTITAKTLNADELAEYLEQGLKIENAEVPETQATEEGTEDNQGEGSE